jgi:alanyl-tRNA synthetase
MTERLYYADSFLAEFDAAIVTVLEGSRPALILDRTAFYPTSGGQVSDTGRLHTGEKSLRIIEVAEDDQQQIVHYLEGDLAGLRQGAPVHGIIDMLRRRDHVQQHSGQHVLSAAFLRLFEMPTLSFHMGAETCTIDLDAKAISAEQRKAAEDLANQVVMEDRQVEIKFVTPQEARAMGVRKLPPQEKLQLRLIDIADFDLTACGGTHVLRTGQIGPIFLRKIEKVKQGIRVEFVCGQRAIRVLHRDYVALSEAAEAFSAQLWDVPHQVRKALENAKTVRKQQEHSLQELAEFHASRLLSETGPKNGFRLVSKFFPDRDLMFIKLLAHNVTHRPGMPVVVILGAGSGEPALVFSQTTGLHHDMGALMKEAMTSLGGRGGGTRDIAQGTVPRADRIQTVLAEIAAQLD